ncbi:MAG: cyclic nucleotide-binding domain-containing protein [SAR324 cluster bacterium]|nr:cyclic nucleotide-binding domain-containing protein [SAR324 cluster bacterium]
MATKKPLGVRVLVVDPYPATRVRLKDTLRGVDFVEAVGEKSNAGGLVEFLGETPFHIVMIDQDPGDGANVFEVVQELKRHPSGKKTHFILVSDNVNEGLVEHGNAVGIRGFLSRPFDLSTVEKSLRTAVAAPAAAPEGLKETLAKLRQVSLFSGFSDTELVRLLKICKSRSIASGQHVFHEGDKGDSLYVVVAGQVDITKISDGQTRVLVSMHPGDCFGEMAIIDDSPRMADAVAGGSGCSTIEVSASIVNDSEDMISLKLVRQIAILLCKKLRAQSQR